MSLIKFFHKLEKKKSPKPKAEDEFHRLDTPQISTSHEFVTRNYTKPTFCNYCSTLLIGLIKQGVKCKICHESYHNDCLALIPATCNGLPDKHRKKSSDDEPVAVKTEESVKTNYFRKNRHQIAGKQVRLQRLSIKVEKNEGNFWSGHMLYYTRRNPTIVTRYWKLDSSSVHIFKSYREENSEDSFTLASVKSVNLCETDSSSPEDYINGQKCFFTLTTDVEKFYCGLERENNEKNTMNVLAGNFFNMFKIAYIPFIKGNQIPWNMKSPKFETKHFEEDYEINYKNLLGSGQFGQVFGGRCKSTGQEAAIKIMTKSLLTDEDEVYEKTNVFQNEFTLLSNIDHPGIIKLFALFDEQDHIYMITEKLSVDMLEMILNKEEKRLHERTAKFIVYQLFTALAKLHSCHIAHCDLKPENILLVENTDLPHVKICDFGYSKIIGDKSMRRCLVGTTAYLPPELRDTQKCYNHSIDIWSMGVIIYVSLSGKFPFEEDREIEGQISDLSCMFPSDPWDEVSFDAIDIINLLLQPKIERRVTARKTLDNVWFSQDNQLYNDLCDLERKLNNRWLTTDEQRFKWNRKT